MSINIRCPIIFHLLCKIVKLQLGKMGNKSIWRCLEAVVPARITVLPTILIYTKKARSPFNRQSGIFFKTLGIRSILVSMGFCCPDLPNEFIQKCWIMSSCSTRISEGGFGEYRQLEEDEIQRVASRIAQCLFKTLYGYFIENSLLIVNNINWLVLLCGHLGGKVYENRFEWVG